MNNERALDCLKKVYRPWLVCHCSELIAEARPDGEGDSHRAESDEPTLMMPSRASE